MGLDPDDRVSLLDELPASVANRLLRSLPYAERDLTAVVLGYPTGSIGRRMNPEYVVVRQSFTAGATLAHVRERLEEAETIYTLPVVDDRRRLVGVVSLREIAKALLGIRSRLPEALRERRAPRPARRATRGSAA